MAFRCCTINHRKGHAAIHRGEVSNNIVKLAFTVVHQAGSNLQVDGAHIVGAVGVLPHVGGEHILVLVDGVHDVTVIVVVGGLSSEVQALQAVSGGSRLVQNHSDSIILRDGLINLIDSGDSSGQTVVYTNCATQTDITSLVIAINHVAGFVIAGKNVLHLGASGSGSVNGKVRNIQSHVRNGHSDDVGSVSAARLSDNTLIVANVEGSDGSVGTSLRHLSVDGVLTGGHPILSVHSHDCSCTNVHTIQPPSLTASSIVSISSVGDFIHFHTIYHNLGSGRSRIKVQLYSTHIGGNVVVIIANISGKLGSDGAIVQIHTSNGAVHAGIGNVSISAVFQLDFQVINLDGVICVVCIGTSAQTIYTNSAVPLVFFCLSLGIVKG